MTEPGDGWKSAMDQYNALSPVERALADDAQRRSWVRGETGHDPGPHPLVAEVETLRKRVAELERALCGVIHAWGDETWGAVTAMERAIPTARAALEPKP